MTPEPTPADLLDAEYADRPLRRDGKPRWWPFPDENDPVRGYYRRHPDLLTPAPRTTE